MAGIRNEGGGVVLVVDDDDEVLQVTAELFSFLGYDVITARNGYEALTILRADDGVDILFADLCMSGIDGNRLVAAARAIRPDLHAILTSGSGQPRERVTFLPKPYHTADLIAALPEAATERLAS